MTLTRGTFKCKICTRTTNNHGNQDGAGVQLCRECYELAGIENEVNDYGDDSLAQNANEIADLFASALRKGADRAKLYQAFKDLNPPQLDIVADVKPERKATGTKRASAPATRHVRDWCAMNNGDQRKARAKLRAAGFHAPYGIEAIAFLNKK